MRQPGSSSPGYIRKGAILVKVVPSRGVSGPLGFESGGLACGIKASGKDDLGLVFSRKPAAVAASFTTNRVAAAPIIVAKENLGKTARAVLINSGNANACTGPQGLKDAHRMVSLAADQLKIDRTEVLIASTGIIGAALPMEALESGIKRLETARGELPDLAFSKAIMTTDAFYKQLAVEITLGGQAVVIGGTAKGAGMIAPDLAPHATMLAVLTTDAIVPAADLQAYLDKSLNQSFNSISVDGDTSTNDCVFALANGAAGAVVSSPNDRAVFQEALDYVCLQLAKMIVRDGEGATKLIVYKVAGAKTARDARQVAKTIADSMLVKTAFFGEDPNWGRFLMAAGKAGVDFEADDLDIDINGVPLVRSGQATGTDLAKVAAEMKGEEIQVWLNLNQGNYQDIFYGCDLSYEYVKINAEYST